MTRFKDQGTCVHANENRMHGQWLSGKGCFILTNYSIHQHALALDVTNCCLDGAGTIIMLVR